MGLITGYICLICFIVLLLKYIARKKHLTKLNKCLMKIHKYVAFVFLLVGVIHLILVINVLDTRALIVTISGIAAVVVGIILTVACHLIKDKKKEIIFHRTFSVIIAGLVIVHVVSYVYDFNKYLMALNQTTIEEIDLSSIEDGEYIGDYDIGYIYAKVKVVVEDHTIKSIDLLEHDHERGLAAEKIVDTMVTKQEIDVDTVSGATNSSIVIKKACANALSGK